MNSASYGQISFGLSAGVLASILSFREYFLINPLALNIDLISALQLFSLLALALLVVVPPVILNFCKIWSKQISRIYICSVLAWPVTLMLIRIVIWRDTGIFLTQYWSSYPILLISEFAPSLIYVSMWLKIGRSELASVDEEISCRVESIGKPRSTNGNPDV